MAKAPVIIWRESVYKNGFKCKCGRELMDSKTGDIAGDVLVDSIGKYMFCPNCKNPVAVIKGETEVEETVTGPQYKGRWHQS